VRHRGTLILIAGLLGLVLAACSVPQTATPIPLKEATPLLKLLSAEAKPAAQAKPAAEAPAPAQAMGAPAAAPSEAPTPRIELPDEVELMPTPTLSPGDSRIDPATLPVGQAGHYVNLAFGYWVQYPPEWHTGFGNRPVQVLFSNLPPGDNSLEEMREQGCLIQIKTTVNVYGFSLAEMRGQMPTAFAGARDVLLGGKPGLRVRRSEEGQTFESEWVYVEHEGRLYLISIDYSPDPAESCLPAWEALLDSWKWFEPRFVPYRNVEYGYSLSVPAGWFPFNASEDGIWISGRDPSAAATVEDLAVDGILVRALVHPNEEELTLREWIEAQNLHVHQTDPLELDDLEGVRVIGESEIPGLEFTSGYYVGRLGVVIEITCLYPADQNWRFSPLANGILYSFSF
jgi:hypothetical protein